MSSRSIYGRGLAAVLVLVLPLVTCGGCAHQNTSGDTLPRVAVSGSVTLDGTPLPAGSIQFVPQSAEAGKGVTASAEITNGKFAIEKDQGPVPGKYHVSISSLHGAVVKPNEQPGGPPKREPEKVPAQYNTRTTLVKDVTAGGPNTLDFALATK
jgi:hypothetical protein